MSTQRVAWARRLIDSGAVLAVLALIVYLLAAAPHIVGNDSAEFSTLGARGGVAHPSGYPGYVLWLRAWSWLPVSAAHAASIATAILGGLSVLVLHAACRAWGAKPAAATISCAVYASAPLVVRYASEADVFAPNQLAVALVLWIAAENGPVRGHRRALLLGITAGLAMTNNLTATLVAPVGLVGVWLATRECQTRRWLPLLLASIGWGAGMLPYVYVFIAPQNALSWPNPTSAGELLDLILRRSYGELDLVGTGEAVPFGAQLRVLSASLARTWLWVLPVAGLITLVVRAVRPRRAPWIALVLSFLLAGPLLVMRFDVDPTKDLGEQLVHRFHLLPALLLVIPTAVALTFVSERVRVSIREALVDAVTHLAFVVLAAISFVDVGRFHTPAMENEARNTLRSLPRNAIILSRVADELDVGVRYLQITENLRTDVTYVRYPDLVVPWYAAKHQIAPAAPRDLVERMHREGRPVFVYWWEQELRAVFPSYTFGVLVRLLPIGERPPSLVQQFEENRTMFESFDLAYPLPGPHDDFATIVHRKYAGTWGRLAAELEAAGHREHAATAYQIARALQPQR